MRGMKIATAADHAGRELKDRLVATLAAAGHEVEDLGTHDDGRVDYPDFADLVARAVAAGRAERGVLVCGTGIGMSMAANRHHGIRAVVAAEIYQARLARAHNDANVLCLGARVTAPEHAEAILDEFLARPFDGGRHEGRIRKLDHPSHQEPA